MTKLDDVLPPFLCRLKNDRGFTAPGAMLLCTSEPVTELTPSHLDGLRHSGILRPHMRRCDSGFIYAQQAHRDPKDPQRYQ